MKNKVPPALALAVALTLAGGRQAQALTITPIFDSSITSDPNAATIEASINAAVQSYEVMLLDPINVSVTFSEMSSGLGESSKFLITDSYTDLLTKLQASQTSTADATALAHLPSQSTNPVNGNANVQVSAANAAALGIFTGSNSTSATISLNTSIMNLSRTGTQNSNKYDLESTVMHELDEVLGLGSALVNGSNGNAAPTGPVMIEDLYRYDQTGARSFTTSATAQAYFSIDGTTDLARFNQTSNSTNSGDFGDWYSFQVAHTPQVQDAYGTPGVILNLDSAEKTALDVIGYTMLSNLTWNPTGTTSGTPPDGAGTWTTASGANWWNGATNAVWSNAPVQNAQFGTPGTASSTAYTVTLGSAITVGEIVFGNANYTINGGGSSLTINTGIVAVANATINAPVILGGNNTWETVGTTTLTAAGNISGGFGLTKQGPGTLILSGSNTYTGGTTVAFGTLQLNSAGALPLGGNVTVSGGALDIDGTSPAIGNLTFGDGVSTTAASVVDSAATKGAITLGGDITFIGTNGGSYFPGATIAANLQLASGTHHITSPDGFIANNYDVVISGSMSGAGGITKDGINYAAFTGANTYSGATVINSGFLFAASTNTLSSASAVTVNSNGVLSLNPTASQTGVTPGNYDQTIGSLAGSGQVQMGSATLTTGADNTSTTFSGAIFGTGGLTKTGTGTMILTAGQGYSGTTTINNGILQLNTGAGLSNSSGVTGLSTGTLVFNSTGNPGFSVPIGGAVNVTQAGTGFLFLLGANTFTGTLTINSGGTVVVGGGATTGTLGAGNTVNNGTLDFERSDTLVVNSPISGSGGLTVFSGGTIVLTGANSYTGQTSLSNGNLQIGNGGTTGSLASGTAVVGNTGTSLIFNRTDAFTFANSINSGMGVTQNGTGTTTLSASSSYTGPTTINAGTLLVSGSISGSTTTVNNGGTLAGTGSTGAVSVVSGGTVHPGGSTGLGLLSTKNVSFASGSDFSIELDGTSGTNTAGVAYSELKVTGSVNLSGDAQITLFPGYTPQINDTFYIILNDGTDAIGGTFSNATGNLLFAAGYEFQVNYAANGDSGTTANDVSLKVIAAIPEPGTGGLLLGGGALFGWRRRRAGRA